MYVALVNGMYSYITSDKNRIEASPAGGTYTFSVVPFWNSIGLLEEAPEWITLTKNDLYTETTWRSDVTATIQPLPDGETGRWADLRIGTWGAETIVRVVQGDVTGIPSINGKSLVSAVRQGDRFVLTYPAGTSSVAVYNVAGQRIAEYALNSGGTYSIPASNLPKGVYLLKFAGKTNETIKVIK
jgi:hypothetical protein